MSAWVDERSSRPAQPSQRSTATPPARLPHPRGSCCTRSTSAVTAGTRARPGRRDHQRRQAAGSPESPRPRCRNRWPQPGRSVVGVIVRGHRVERRSRPFDEPHRQSLRTGGEWRSSVQERRDRRAVPTRCVPVDLQTGLDRLDGGPGIVVHQEAPTRDEHSDQPFSATHRTRQPTAIRPATSRPSSGASDSARFHRFGRCR
jgi:hypothetical protein